MRETRNADWFDERVTWWWTRLSQLGSLALCVQQAAAQLVCLVLSWHYKGDRLGIEYQFCFSSAVPRIDPNASVMGL